MGITGPSNRSLIAAIGAVVAADSAEALAARGKSVFSCLGPSSKVKFSRCFADASERFSNWCLPVFVWLLLFEKEAQKKHCFP